MGGYVYGAASTSNEQDQSEKFLKNLKDKNV